MSKTLKQREAEIRAKYAAEAESAVKNLRIAEELRELPSKYGFADMHGLIAALRNLVPKRKVCKYLNADEVRTIKERLAAGESHAALAKEYDVTVTTIYNRTK